MWGNFIIVVFSRYFLMPNLIFSISRSPKFLIELRWNYLLCIVCCWKSTDKPASLLETAGQRNPCGMPHLLLASHSLWVWVFFLKKILLPVLTIVETDLGCRWKSCCGLTHTKVRLYIGSSRSRKWVTCLSVCLSISGEPRWGLQGRAWVNSFEKSFTSLLKRFASTECTALLMTEEIIDNMSSSTSLVGISILCYLQS